MIVSIYNIMINLPPRNNSFILLALNIKFIEISLENLLRSVAHNGGYRVES